MVVVVVVVFGLAGVVWFPSDVVVMVGVLVSIRVSLVLDVVFPWKVVGTVVAFDSNVVVLFVIVSVVVPFSICVVVALTTIVVVVIVLLAVSVTFAAVVVTLAAIGSGVVPTCTAAVVFPVLLPPTDGLTVDQRYSAETLLLVVVPVDAMLLTDVCIL